MTNTKPEEIRLRDRITATGSYDVPQHWTVGVAGLDILAGEQQLVPILVV